MTCTICDKPGCNYQALSAEVNKLGRGSVPQQLSLNLERAYRACNLGRVDWRAEALANRAELTAVKAELAALRKQLSAPVNDSIRLGLLP